MYCALVPARALPREHSYLPPLWFLSYRFCLESCQPIVIPRIYDTKFCVEVLCAPGGFSYTSFDRLNVGLPLSLHFPYSIANSLSTPSRPDHVSWTPGPRPPRAGVRLNKDLTFFSRSLLHQVPMGRRSKRLLCFLVCHKRGFVKILFRRRREQYDSQRRVLSSLS